MLRMDLRRLSRARALAIGGKSEGEGEGLDDEYADRRD
jgi:hypothetical protein